MNKRRLLKLAEFLETAELPGEFHLGNWAGRAINGAPACGTVACALGWAATIPEFARLGFRLDDRWPFFPVYRDLEGFRAGARLFGIPNDKAEWLFMPYRYRATPEGKRGRKTVAKRIRKLVASA